MKHKSRYIFVILFLLISCITAFFFFKDRFNTNDSNYDAQKTASNNVNESEHSNMTSDNNSNTSNSTNSAEKEENKPKETQAGIFTTKIYTKESARQNNMELTASRLNGHIVKNGETFSFCNTLGPSSSSNGYQEADIFDKNGNKKKGLGGGNCQISSTLYNAVLATPNLVVIERHEHSNDVPYVAKGKDAAVAYGSYDFKFRNDTGNDIKILFEVTKDNVTASIVLIQ